MAIVAGIDEAGLGPLLGPLTVVTAVFQVPDELAEQDFWKLLAPQVSSRASKRDSSVAIADSKKLFKHASGGLANLERAVLGSLSLLRDNPLDAAEITLVELLGKLCPQAIEKLRQYPWYTRGLAKLPLDAEATDLRLRANGMRDALHRSGIDLLGMTARILNVIEYNANIARTNNKAVTLTDQTFWLLDWVWRNRPPGQKVIIYIDRQGGRQKYLPSLQRIYPDHLRAQVLNEQPDHSDYRLQFQDGELDVHFLKKGETHKLPIALASMTAKYLRELYMKMFNDWWAFHAGDEYIPTAGYYTDALRFLSDNEKLRQTLNVPDALLIRSR